MKISYLLLLLLFANIACVPPLVDNESVETVVAPNFTELDFNHNLFKSKANNRQDGISKNAATAAYRLELAHSYFSEFVDIELSIFNELVSSIKNFRKSEVSSSKFISFGKYNGEFSLKGSIQDGLMNWEMVYEGSDSSPLVVMIGSNDYEGKILNWEIGSTNRAVHTVNIDKVDGIMEVTFLSEDVRENIQVNIEKTEKSELIQFKNLYSEFSVALNNETPRGWLEERSSRVCWDEDLKNAICN